MLDIILPGNYLRVRGEYAPAATSARVALELPPRARRIPASRFALGLGIGTTSACAENTCVAFCPWPWNRNYLRVRGEYRGLTCANDADLELPPRARRIHLAQTNKFALGGTTSACAENTIPFSSSYVNRRNYLRVRGEYPSVILRSQ